MRPLKVEIPPEYRCPYEPDNTELLCVEKTCEKCGWNPEVKQARIARIKRSGGIE